MVALYLGLRYATDTILEKVQRRAARWVMSDYSWSSSVTVMLNHLGWPTLVERRLFA